MRFLIGIFILVLFFSCKKKEEKDPYSNTYVHDYCGGSHTASYIDADAKKLKFRPNSYWVYFDSITFQTDSAFIDSVVFDGTFSDYYSCHTAEIYIYKLRSGLSGTSQPYILGGKILERNSLGPWHPGNGTFIYVSYTSPTSSGIYNGPSVDTIFTRDSLFVYDHFYRHIVVSQRVNDPDEDSLKTIYYSNSDYGLLRKDVFNANGTLKNKWLLKTKNVIR